MFGRRIETTRGPVYVWISVRYSSAFPVDGESIVQAIAKAIGAASADAALSRFGAVGALANAPTFLGDFAAIEHGAATYVRACVQVIDERAAAAFIEALRSHWNATAHLEGEPFIGVSHAAPDDAFYTLEWCGYIIDGAA